MLKNQHVALDFWLWPQTTCAQAIPTPFVSSSFLTDHRMTPSSLPHLSSVSDCTFPHATAGLFMCWRMEGDRTRPSARPLPSHCLRSWNNSCIWLPFASTARFSACVCACGEENSMETCWKLCQWQLNTATMIWFIQIVFLPQTFT